MSASDMDKAVTTNSARHLCWSCKEEVGAGPFCGHCVKIQPVQGLNTYFTLFEIPESYDVDQGLLKQKFYELSRRLHPDYYSQMTPTEQRLARDNSAYLNAAFQTLSEPLRRAEYLLSLHAGAIGGNPSPPQELFEEILSAGELLDMEQLSEGDRAILAGCGEAFRVRQKEYLASLGALFDALDKNGEAAGKTIEERLNNIKYLRTILNRIDKRLEQAG